MSFFNNHKNFLDFFDYVFLIGAYGYIFIDKLNLIIDYYSNNK